MRGLAALVDIVPPAIVSIPPLADPISIELFVSVPVSVTAPWEIFMVPASDTMPDSVNVPVPAFERPLLVMAEPIVALAFAVIVGLLPAKPSVPPVSV